MGHQLVAVEETPAEHIRSRGTDYQSGASYNKDRSSKDELLCSCYDDPYCDVRAMLLAHNHIMLVLRAFLTGAKWELLTDMVRGTTYLDADGKLSVTAVAGSPNGKERGEILEDE